MGKWHEGDAWASHLELYDSFVSKFFGDAEIRNVTSKFGTTRAYLCGTDQDKSKPPVVLMHGANDFSFLWEFVIPGLLKEGYYVIAVDRMGDMGRSLPRDGLTSSVPSSEEETIEWLFSVKKELGLAGRPCSFVCHSYGGFVSTMFALAHNDEVHKLILTGPAAVVAPQKIPDAIYLPIFRTISFIRWILPKSMKISFWDSIMSAMGPPDCNVDELLLIDLYRSVACLPNEFQLIAGVPHAWPVETLKNLNETTPVLLLCGEQETAFDPKVGVANAQAAKIPSKTYPNTGHATYINNGPELAQDILAFLAGKEVPGSS